MKYAIALVSALVSATLTFGQDAANRRMDVTVTTRDRQIVPLTLETKETKVGANTTKTESIARVRRNDGTSFDWRDTATVQRKLGEGVTESSSQTTEQDRQGGARVIERTTERIVTRPDGLQTTAAAYRRSASGNLILDSEVTVTTTVSPDGNSVGLRVEKRADVNGVLQPVRQVESTTVKRDTGETVTTGTIKSYDHLQGGFAVTGRETTVTRGEGSTTRSETLTQKSSGTSWNDEARTVRTETKLPDGSIRRETIEESRSLYSRLGGAPSLADPLVPQRRIIEHEVRKPDGVVVMEREVYRRDVNGDWKPATFSSETTAAGF